MGNSDSDSENECFESAEESLEEDEEVESTGTKLKESDSEVAKPITDFDNVNSTTEVEKGISSNSMSYRKRPDSVKRSISNITTKPLAKLPSSDTIFKTDKIVPDAFFQDITNNLSKNINKSLSTLHQKSSNIKDLILSTLPVSSVDDSKRFSYDDDTVYAPSGKDEFPNAEGVSPNKNQVIENVGVEKIKKKEETSQVEAILTNSSISCSKIEKKPPKLNTKRPEESLEEKSGFKSNTLVDKIKEEISNRNPVIERLDASDKNTTDGETHKEELESVSESDSLLVSNQAFSDSNSTDVLHDQDGASNIDINKLKSVTPLNQTDKKSEMMVIMPTKSEKIESHYTQNLDCEKSPEVAELNLSPLDENNITSSEVIMKNTFCLSDSRILPENDDSDLNSLVEVKKEVECNLEELKTALENIVKDKANTLNENNGILEDVEKEDFTHEERIKEIPQSSNDGWDDFDFSDNEIENVEANKTDFGSGDLKEKGSEVVTDDEAGVTEKKSISNSKECAEAETKVVSNSMNNKDLILKQEVHSNFKNDSNAIKLPQHVPEAESVPDDSWDWNDSWVETVEDKNQEAEVATAKSKSEKIQDDSSDISKWTGWDTFGQKSPEKQVRMDWSLGSWGVDMLLNKATAVTQGISNVLEAGLGAPDPETLARMEKAEWRKLKEQEMLQEDQEDSGEISKRNSLTNVNLFPVSGITNLVAGVTSKIVEHSKIQEIGSKVITGGLDTLETFGKKTMEVLQEGDPGLKNKRALLMGNTKPILSQVLKEAREKADREMKKVEEKEMAKKCHFETLFDDFQGMVHLEALEMLSRQCELKLEQIRLGMNSEEQEDLNGILEEVRQLCALDECELDLKSSVLDFKTVLQMVVEPLQNEISLHKIIQIHENTNKWLEMSSETEPSLITINQKLVSTLAELAAATVQQFHKSGELLSVKECRKTVEESDALSRLTNVLCTEINRLCEKFILLSQNKRDASAESLNSMTEKVTVEMKNSTSYIRQAFDLLIPVIQLGAAV